MSSLYRDPLAGLKSQVATKRAALQGREAAIPRAVRVLLPERLRGAIEELRPKVHVPGEDMEALSAADGGLVELDWWPPYAPATEAFLLPATAIDAVVGVRSALERAPTRA